jgi:2-O-methyltransferase
MDIESIRNEDVPYNDCYTLDGYSFGRSLFNMEWVTAVTETPKVIFDIGCYDMGDSIRFKHRYPGADVYSFEASHYRHEKLKETAAKYGLNFVPFAVSDKVGTATFFDAEVFDDEGKIGPRIDAQGSFFQHTDVYKYKNPRIKQKPETTEVQTITVENFCAEKNIAEIDVLYVDVEGAELQVVKGMGNLRPKMVFVETLDFVNPNAAPMWQGEATKSTELESYLFSLGYQLVKILHADRLYIHSSAIK